MSEYEETFEGSADQGRQQQPRPEPSQAPQLFEDRSQELLAQRDAGAIARATQEIQAALVIAQRFPRDEIKAEMKILKACQRKGLAEVSEYEYSRGGTRITGPTIDLLRAIANRWGNLLYGWEEAERQDGQSRVRCWAWDTQNNSRAERTFVVVHWRDTSSGGYELKDERDIYEMIANQAARRVRSCLQEVIDSDIVDRAIEACRKTLKQGETTPLKDRAITMLNAFGEFAVTQEMIEKRLGNKLEAISENQLASLRRVYKSLKDGVGTRDDYFKPGVAAPAFGAQGEPQPGGTNTPATSPAAPEASQAPETPLKKVRNLCKTAKIKEGVLLSYLAEVGKTDGSVSSLDELAMTAPLVLQFAINDWTDIAARIAQVQKAGKA